MTKLLRPNQMPRIHPHCKHCKAPALMNYACQANLKSRLHRHPCADCKKETS